MQNVFVNMITVVCFVLCYQCYCAKKTVTTMLTYPWKCTVLHCNHLGNIWKPLVLMTRHFDYCPSASESSAPVVSRCFPGGYNVKLYISRGRLAWWLLVFFSQCVFYFLPFVTSSLFSLCYSSRRVCSEWKSEKSMFIV